MKSTISRRKFVGMGTCGSLVLAQSALGNDLFWEFLQTDEAALKIFQILRENFGLTAEDRQVAKDFHQSLIKSKDHGVPVEQIKAGLKKACLDERLEVLVIEEFVASTNYFAWQQGEAKNLKFIGRLA